MPTIETGEVGATLGGTVFGFLVAKGTRIFESSTKRAVRNLVDEDERRQKRMDSLQQDIIELESLWRDTRHQLRDVKKDLRIEQAINEIYRAKLRHNGLELTDEEKREIMMAALPADNPPIK